VDQITIALPKGRLLKPSLKALEAAGIWRGPFPETDGLVLDRDETRVIVIRDDDVATYVANGAADIGVVGKDVLAEQNKDVVELGDLRFGCCRLVVAAPAKGAHGGPVLRVASKYPSIAEEFLSRKGYPFQVIKVHGSTELAPAMGLADAIIDMVETGRTLARNGLVEVEEVLKSSARLIVNPASYTLKHEAVGGMASRITSAVSGGDWEGRVDR
jgi:ATP phosphoribosyltransferase